MKTILLQSDLPLQLRYYVLVPLTVVFVVATGLLFTLPPGPLCDEGMVLFMEGGCDFGDSNVFFFSKVGALVAVNFAFLLGSRRGRLPPAAFLPHLALLSWLGWWYRSGGSCDTYYSHPNGSIGQMALEISAFAVLGLALLPIARETRAPIVATVALLWNGAYIASFYAWLSVTDHWTWTHTWLVCMTMLVAAIGVAANQSLRRRATRGSTCLSGQALSRG